MATELHWADFLTLGLYFVLVLAVGIWSTFKSNRTNTSGYFLAGKHMTWIPIGASIFASNVGAPMFIGLAGSAAASGFAVVTYEWHAVFMIIMLGWIYVPVYIASGAYTMPEYLKKRFGGERLRIYLSMLGIALYVLTKISIEMYAGAIFIQQVLDWDLYLSVVLILGVTAVYTVVGGLVAVIYTDTLQTGILLLGCTILAIKSLVDVGGYESLMSRYRDASANYTLEDFRLYKNHTCGMPDSDYEHIFRDPITSNYPWPGMTFGLTPIAMWVWCNDQVMVQRCLAAKDIGHAKAGTILGSLLKLYPFLLFILPGMISRVLYPDEIACATPEACLAVCKNAAGCTNIAYPLLVLRNLPPGLRGVMLAALLAALMSSLTSIFNSASSLITMDLWKKCRPHAKESELMIVGRVSVLILVCVSIAWLPILQSAGGGTLWDYMQAVSSYIAPPWCICFVIGVFWTRATEEGAFWGLMVGLLVGVIRMTIDFCFPAPLCGSGDSDTRPEVLSKVHYLYFSILLSGICTVVTVVVSLLTKPRSCKQLHKVTWWTRHDDDEPCLTDDEDSDDDDGEIEQFQVEPRRNDHVGKITLSRRILKWACGISDAPKPRITKADLAIMRKKMTSIKENPFWERVLNISAVLCLTATVFLFGFFS